MKKIIGAFDLGASGSKFLVGIFDKDDFSIREIHRFSNKPVNLYLATAAKTPNIHKIYWNDLYMYDEIITGLSKLPESGINHLDSLGVDTWGADGECFTKEGEITGRVHNYRDHRLDNTREQLFKIIPKRELFQLTGIISQPFNQVNQLFWLANKRQDVLQTADCFLPITSIFYYYLCGARICEYTWASVTQLLNASEKDWSAAIFEKLNIPISIMPPVVEPGTKIGTLHRELAEDTGMNQAKIIATAAHDTACAYAAAPVEEEENSLIISSGTWSLVGRLIPEPIINDTVFKNGFTNEGGIGNIRLLRNVMGTWLIQELRRIWSEEDNRELTWDRIVKMAQSGEKFYAFIDPDDNSFYNPDNMEQEIKKFCKKTGQKIPDRRETTLRIVYESLALKYRLTNEIIEKITGRKTEKVYIVGGGAKNSLLNQFTAEATGLSVTAGPFEATAIGNILIQAKALGIIESLKEGREQVKHSLPATHYHSKGTSWEKEVKSFKTLMQKLDPAKRPVD